MWHAKEGSRRKPIFFGSSDGMVTLPWYILLVFCWFVGHGFQFRPCVSVSV